MLRVQRPAPWCPWSSWSTLIYFGPQFQRCCYTKWTKLDQDGSGIDQGHRQDHGAGWWTRSVENHLGSLKKFLLLLMGGRLLQKAGRRQINHSRNTAHGWGHAPQTAFASIWGGLGSRAFRGRGRATFNGRDRGGFRPRQIELAVPRGILNDGCREFALTGSQVPTGTKCHYCCKSGHWKRESYKWKAEGGTESGINGTKEFTF